MKPVLTSEVLPSLPKLAWLARFDPGTGVVHALRGTSVESGDGFLVEGVWDGSFADAGFHRAEHFFGSGIRVEGEDLWLVPSRALVDRVLCCFHGGELIASNSLALLLGYTGARLDPAFDYRPSSHTVLNGIDHYDPRIPVVHPAITEFRQLYHHPVRVTPGGLEKAEGGAPARIASFEEYTGLVGAALSRLRDNLASPERRSAVKAFSTISAGYDSPAVTALAREMVDACFTSRRSNSSILPWMSRAAAIDDGTPIAERLGLRTLYLDPGRGSVSEDELYFLAPTAADPELVFHSMARHIEASCEAAVVFTGFHGDKVWDVDTGGDYLSDQVKRGDTSGLNLGEIRLKAGFFNVPVTFMYARSVRDLVAVSRSDAMRPWRLHNGYDRPIPRRILEEAGVPRGYFGQRKKAVVQKYDCPVNPRLRASFLAHMRERHGWTYGRMRLQSAANRAAFLAAAVGERAARLLGARARDVPVAYFRKDVNLPYEMHLWALEALARELAAALPQTARAPAAARARTAAAGG
jgi:hypothetical protein